jgi:nitrite reductase/ring-hydroxylating ferredoxin subunit
METDLQDGGNQALSEKTVLCALEDLGDPGSKGFEPEDGDPFFIVRQGDQVFGYVNSCPHYGSTLEWKDDTFLSYDKDLIQCSLHAALFRIHDGHCIDGPCTGADLKLISVRVEAGQVVLEYPAAAT